MRIALFTDSYYPEINGVANSVYTLYHGLAARGHEVHVFAPRSKLPGAESDPRVHYLPSLPLVLLRDRNLSMFGPLLVRRLRRLRVDVVHTNSEFAAGYLGRLVAHGAPCASVHTYHTVWEDYTYYVTHGHGDRQARFLAQKYSRLFCNRCDRIIAPSQKIEDLLRRYGVRIPIDIVPSGMDLRRFDPALRDEADRQALRAECGVRPGERVLLSIGRISKEKNLDQVVRVFSRLLAFAPDARLVLLGEGPWIEPLRQLAERLGCLERVSFPGPRPYAQIHRYYAIGDAFVSASHSETQGLTYIEALASGLCLVAYDDPCLRGVVQDGENGLLFPDDDDAMLAALQRALGPDGRALAQAAPPSVERFSKEAFVRAVERVYEDAIRAAAARRARWDAGEEP